MNKSASNNSVYAYGMTNDDDEMVTPAAAPDRSTGIPLLHSISSFSNYGGDDYDPSRDSVAMMSAAGHEQDESSHEGIAAGHGFLHRYLNSSVSDPSKHAYARTDSDNYSHSNMSGLSPFGGPRLHGRTDSDNYPNLPVLPSGPSTKLAARRNSSTNSRSSSSSSSSHFSSNGSYNDNLMNPYVYRTGSNGNSRSSSYQGMAMHEYEMNMALMHANGYPGFGAPRPFNSRTSSNNSTHSQTMDDIINLDETQMAQLLLLQQQQNHHQYHQQWLDRLDGTAAPIRNDEVQPMVKSLSHMSVENEEQAQM
jgi:hypothetical protein